MTKSLATKTIDEITEKLIDYRGKTPPKASSGIRLVTAKVVKDGFIQDENYEYISEDTYHLWMTRGLPKQAQNQHSCHQPQTRQACEAYR